MQGGLTIIVVVSGLDGATYAYYLRKMGLRALFSDNLSIDVSQLADYRELDVLLIHAKGSYPKMTTLLNDSKLRIAVVAIDAADRASKLSPYYQHYYLEWLKTRPKLPKRVGSFIYSTHTTGDEVIKDMQRIYGLPPSSELVVRQSFWSNLSIDAIKLPRNHDKFSTILQLLERTSAGLTVILTATGKVAEAVATKLQREGYDARAITIPREKAGKKSVEVFEEIVDASEPILCVEKGTARHLPHQDIRHVIWHCLAHSPHQFHVLNKIVGRDGVQSRCTALLSEQEIFNANNTSLAMSPSLHHIRLAIAEILRRHEGLKAGSISWVEMMRVRFLADLNDEDANDLLKFLCEQGIIEVCQSWHLQIQPGPRLENASKEASNSMGFDMVQALEEATNSRLDDDTVLFGKRVPEFVASGLFQTQREKKLGSPLRIFKLIKLARDISQQEIDSLVQKFAARLHSHEDERVEARRKYLGLFTRNRCISTSLAEVAVSDVPPAHQACGHCLFCVTHKPVAITPLSQIEKPVDLNRLNTVIRAVPEDSAKDPRLLTRVALGMLSTRVKELSLQEQTDVFGRMRLNGFEVCISLKSGLLHVEINNTRVSVANIYCARTRNSSKHLRNDLEFRSPKFTSIERDVGVKVKQGLDKLKQTGNFKKPVFIDCSR